MPTNVELAEEIPQFVLRHGDAGALSGEVHEDLCRHFDVDEEEVPYLKVVAIMAHMVRKGILHTSENGGSPKVFWVCDTYSPEARNVWDRLDSPIV